MTAHTAMPENEIHLERRRIQAALDGFLVVRSSDARILDVNETCCGMTGYSREELLSMRIPDLDAEASWEEISAQFKNIMAMGQGRFESCYRHKHGHSVDLEISVGHPELDGGIVYLFIRDITERKRAERYEQFRAQTLELLSGGAPLPVVLENIVRGVERLNPEMICSILLLDGEHLSKGIAPSLPDAYNAALDGIEIGVGVGCCGTAAFTGERVIVDDIQTHPYWAPYRELAADAGVGACWSQPIRSSSGQVLGTFAVYHRQAHSHTESDLSLIEKTAHLASIAIERKAMEQAIAANEQAFRSLAETSPDHIVRYDREGRHLYLNAKLLKLLRLASADEVIGKRPGEVWPDGRFAEVEKAAARAVENGCQEEIELTLSSENGAIDYHQVFIVPERDANGRIVGTIALGRIITAIREDERKLKRFIENLPGVAYTFHWSPDGHGSFPYVSPAIEEIYGLKPEDVKEDMAPIHLLAHPEDRPRIEAAIAESGRTMAPFRIESRVCRPGLPERWLDVRSAPDRQADGSVLWHGIMLDITERKQAELERQANADSLECLDKINKAMLGPKDQEQMMGDVLDIVLAFFGCDRAFLLHPCDPEAPEWRVPMERTTAEYPGVRASRAAIPMDESAAGIFRAVLNADGAVMFGPEGEYPIPPNLSGQFGIKSQMSMALFPKLDKPWQFGIHQCSHARKWSDDEKALFEKIGWRLSAALTGLLMYRNLQASEQKFRTLAENLPLHLVSYDREFRRTYINSKLVNDLRVTPEQMIGKTLDETNPANISTLDLYQQALRHTLATGEHQELAFETLGTSNETRTHMIFTAPERTADGRISGVIAIGRDITELKQAERQLRELTAHLQTIREEEKAHLAREIHDELGGILVALKVETHLLTSNLPAEQKETPLFAGIATMAELLDEALNTIRRIITDLRPTVLDDHGLFAAFEWQAAQFHKFTGIECRIACAVMENDTCTGCQYYEHSLNKPLSITLFRILQESLNNVARHSGASMVEVELRPHDQEMTLTISDNGHGLPERFVIASSSHGIRGMRERVEQLGGKIELAKPPGGGLSVIARFPLSAATQ